VKRAFETQALAFQLAEAKKMRLVKTSPLAIAVHSTMVPLLRGLLPHALRHRALPHALRCRHDLLSASDLVQGQQHRGRLRWLQ
jgi:hypothetical protein